MAILLGTFFYFYCQMHVKLNYKFIYIYILYIYQCIYKGIMYACVLSEIVELFWKTTQAILCTYLYLKRDC